MHPSILLSVAEVAGSGQDHGEAESVGGFDRVFVADGASGLCYGCDAAIGSHFDAVREREVGVGGEDRSQSLVLSYAEGEVNTGDAVGLSGSHADEVVVLRKDDGVGLDVLAGAPGEGEVAELVIGGSALGYDLPVGWVFGDVVGGLDEGSAGDGAQIQAGRRAALRGDFEDAGAGASS